MKNIQDLEKIVSDTEIESVWGNADFGPDVTKREIIALGVLKYASGYHTGNTLQSILKQLGLLTIKLHLTKKGKAYLWSAYSS
jgi:hypothetical protein